MRAPTIHTAPHLEQCLGGVVRVDDHLAELLAGRHLQGRRHLGVAHPDELRHRAADRLGTETRGRAGHGVVELGRARPGLQLPADARPVRDGPLGRVALPRHRRRPRLVERQLGQLGARRLHPGAGLVHRRPHRLRLLVLARQGLPRLLQLLARQGRRRLGLAGLRPGRRLGVAGVGQALLHRAVALVAAVAGPRPRELPGRRLRRLRRRLGLGARRVPRTLGRRRRRVQRRRVQLAELSLQGRHGLALPGQRLLLARQRALPRH